MTWSVPPPPYPAGESPAQHHAHLHLHGSQHHASGRRLQLQGDRQDGPDGHTCSDQGERSFNLLHLNHRWSVRLYSEIFPACRNRKNIPLFPSSLLLLLLFVFRHTSYQTAALQLMWTPWWRGSCTCLPTRCLTCPITAGCPSSPSWWPRWGPAASSGS